MNIAFSYRQEAGNRVYKTSLKHDGKLVEGSSFEFRSTSEIPKIMDSWQTHHDVNPEQAADFARRLRKAVTTYESVPGPGQISEEAGAFVHDSIMGNNGEEGDPVRQEYAKLMRAGAIP